MKNLKQLLGLCEHKWAVVNTADIVGNESKVVKGQLITLRCEKCGDIKHREHNVN